MISNYISRKKDGYIEIEKDNEKLKVKMKHYNEWTGEETELEEEEIVIADLERELAVRQNQCIEIQALIDDLKKL